MKGIYLGACRAYHPNYDLDYNDIVGGYHINIISDMLTVDLSKYNQGGFNVHQVIEYFLKYINE